ncbi:DinB family protein [Deinococcus yavapaiensis]|nr:DinB family protein [Deinococcus yavapaiensis]
MIIPRRPTTDEYHSFYETYVRLVDAETFEEDLRDGAKRVAHLLGSVPEEDAGRAPASGKWSLKQVVAHLSDTERVFSFRMLWIARGGTEPLPGFDQDVWAANRDVTGTTFRALLDEFEGVRATTLSLVRSLRSEDFDRRGVVSGHGATVLALAFMIVGHAKHHERALHARVAHEAR